MGSRVILLIFLSLLLSASFASGQENSCTVTLKNGNTVNANSYRIERGRLYLKYPIGEASFELSQVESISGGGDSDLLQDKGKPQRKNEGQTARAAAASAPSGTDDAAGKAGAMRKTRRFNLAAGGNFTAQANPKSQPERERKFQEFFERYEQSDDGQRAELDKQIDEVFSDYLDTAYSSEQH